MGKWEDAQKWESEWHGLCVNTYGEELKQFLYADKMGLVRTPNANTPYRFDLGGISVIDIGGGPASLLLKCENVIEAVVFDPLKVPKWIKSRYTTAGISFISKKAEELPERENKYDEAWIYNCLQHTDNPELIIKKARKAARLIRIFEWIDCASNIGHPHTLTEKNLNKWLKGEGKTEELKGQNNCWGKCFYGIFDNGNL